MVATLRGSTNTARNALWAVSPLDGRLDPVRGQVEQHTIRDLRATPEGLWLAVDGGAAVLDPQTLVVDAFKCLSPAMTHRYGRIVPIKTT